MWKRNEKDKLVWDVDYFEGNIFFNYAVQARAKYSVLIYETPGLKISD